MVENTSQTHLLDDKVGWHLMNRLDTKGILSGETGDHGRAITSESGDRLEIRLVIGVLQPRTTNPQ